MPPFRIGFKSNICIYKTIVKDLTIYLEMDMWKKTKSVIKIFASGIMTLDYALCSK